MNIKDIEQKLVEIFRVTLGSNMHDAEIRELKRSSYPQWSSMAHLNLILAAEESFEVSIPEVQGAEITSFVDMTTLIHTLRQPG